MASYDAEYLKLRLDPQNLHKNILNFLQGTRNVLIFDEKVQQWREEVQASGVPLANEEGIQALLSFVICLVNEHTIQGNTKGDQLNSILLDLETGLIEEMTLNYEDYGINPARRSHILKTIMTMCRFVLSRTIDNLERPSYSPTIEKTSKYYSNGKSGSVV